MMIKSRDLRIIILLTIIGYSCNKVNNSSNTPVSNITITSLRPTHGPFDTIDTLTGQGFDQIPAFDSILLNGKAITIVSRSSDQIIVKIPALAGTGNIDIWYKGKMIMGPVFTYDSILLVTTIAGDTAASFDVNGNGLNARFAGPYGICVDRYGNIYVSEAGGATIRKIDTARNVTTLAGPSVPEDAYVDGLGSTARFSSPLGLCIDTSGNLYVADQFNYRVRKVTPNGMVSTFAGSAWDGIPGHGETDGPGSVATFDNPQGVAADKNGNIYVADTYNNKIRKITSAGVVSSFAGADYIHFGYQDGQGSSALFYVPNEIAVDPFGNVFTVDYENHILRKITPDGTVHTLLSGTEPYITGPYDTFSAGPLATDKYGNLFFAISVGIIKMSPDGTITRYATGGIGEADGPAQVATYRAISGIAVDDNGVLYITDDNRIRRIAWQ